MPDCDPERRLFLSAPRTHNRFFFLHAFHFRKRVFDNAVISIADVHDIVMTIPWRLVTSTLTTACRDVRYNQCISNTRQFSIFIFLTWQIRVCEIRFASTGVICENPYPVCKNIWIHHKSEISPRGRNFIQRRGLPWLKFLPESEISLSCMDWLMMDSFFLPPLRFFWNV